MRQGANGFARIDRNGHNLLLRPCGSGISRANRRQRSSAEQRAAAQSILIHPANPFIWV
jgi:hypothetical protein